MFFHVCKICKKFVWFWQSKGELLLTLKNGKKRTVHLCYACATILANQKDWNEIEVRKGDV